MKRLAIGLVLLAASTAGADITTNLKLHYKLDEGTSTSAADSSASGLTGTLSSSGWSTGKVGANSANLSGGKSIAVGTSNTLNFTGTALTIAAWINPTTVSDYYRICERGGTYPAVQWSFVFDGPTGKLRFELDRSGLGSAAVGVAAIPLNVWSHVAVVYNGATIKMYVNGVQDQSLAYTGSITSYAGATCFVGKYTGGAGYEFPGKMDDVRIYDRALTVGDLLELYQLGGIGSRSRFTNHGGIGRYSRGSMVNE